MFNFTRQERTVILIFFSALGIGAAISFLSKSIPQVEYIEKFDISQKKKININTADKAVIEKIPHIGPKLAQKIIEFRGSIGGFSDLEQLKSIKGIKEKKLEALKEYLSVDGEN